MLHIRVKLSFMQIIQAEIAVVIKVTCYLSNNLQVLEIKSEK
jgi:hypothetical protein